MRRRLDLPFVRRLAWYGRRIRLQLSPGIIARVLLALFVVVAVAALLETLLERPVSLEGYAASFFWAFTSLLGNGDPGSRSGRVRRAHLRRTHHHRRVEVPEGYVGLPIDEVSQHFRDDHHSTLLAISRLGRTYMNPVPEFQVLAGDETLVVAESLGDLVPVHEWSGLIDESTVQAPATESAPA